VAVSEELLILASCLLRPMSRNSVLEEFSVRRFPTSKRFVSRVLFKHFDLFSNLKSLVLSVGIIIFCVLFLARDRVLSSIFLCVAHILLKFGNIPIYRWPASASTCRKPSHDSLHSLVSAQTAENVGNASDPIGGVMQGPQQTWHYTMPLSPLVTGGMV